MPTYEYQCKSCKAVYELRQGFDAEITHKCEECGKGVAKRILSSPAVVFKGGGWYATDSRNTKSAVMESDSAATPAADASSSSDAPKETKAKESKSEAKKPAATSSESAAAG